MAIEVVSETPIVCTGAGWNSDHCCYLAGVRCVYLVENTAGRRYACGLFLKYGSWEAMNESPEYQPVGEYWVSTRGTRPFNYCETFSPLFCCRSDPNPGFANETESRQAGAI